MGERCALPGVWCKCRDVQLGRLASETGYVLWETERWGALRGRERIAQEPLACGTGQGNRARGSRLRRELGLG